jgi:hypothetical protein
MGNKATTNAIIKKEKEKAETNKAQLNETIKRQVADVRNYTIPEDEEEVFAIDLVTINNTTKCYEYATDTYSKGMDINLSLYRELYPGPENPPTPYRFFAKKSDIQYAGRYLGSIRKGSEHSEDYTDVFLRNNEENHIKYSSMRCYKEVPCQSSSKGWKCRHKSKRIRRLRRKTSRKY